MTTGKKKAVKVTAKKEGTVKKKTATPSGKTKTSSASKSPALVWQTMPYFREDYASYKLGTIYRKNGVYGYRINFERFEASSLADAKRKLDEYSKKKIGR